MLRFSLRPRTVKISSTRDVSYALIVRRSVFI